MVLLPLDRHSAMCFLRWQHELFRNFGLAFSLIIPVIAGIGLNFGIVLGAMAAQAGYIFVTHWRIQGLMAIVGAVLICTPLSILFGWLLGKLFNRQKAQDMITGHYRILCQWSLSDVFPGAYWNPDSDDR
ncbi:MAG: hypothetical protein V8S58_12765 [Lachnospiraceae bacterium]